MQDKTKKKIKVRDLKTRKDAKGGLLPAVTPAGNPLKGNPHGRPALSWGG